MAVFAMCMPILPGKLEMWKGMMAQVIDGPMSADFKASREAAGGHERTFLQETPNGHFIILTFEGDDPQTAFANLMGNMDEDFKAFAAEVHGLDPEAPMSFPELVFDSRA